MGDVRSPVPAGVVRQSQLFGYPLRNPPKDAETASHRFLVQGGFIHQLAAGVFSLLPLGFRVHQRIVDIIREEMNALGAQEVLLPALHPKGLWEETGRWREIDPPLFTLTDRHDRQYALAPTHEEVITDLARTYVHSYQQLPVAVFQIQTKFRNEQRPTGGLLRTREFVMKDLYSFHESEDDLIRFYGEVRKAYVNIFERCGLKTVPVQAESGSIGGSVSSEFVVLAETGEDKVALCSSCGFGAKQETLSRQTASCPECGHALEVKNCIESGHIFQLGQKYSRAMRAQIATKEGTKEFLVMGCYGIGVGRLLAAIIEAHHDDKGIRWPETVAPFDAHLVGLRGSGKGHGDVAAATDRALGALTTAGVSVLHDDRKDASAGEKFADADLIGIPWRIVVSEKHAQAGTAGLKRRGEADEVAVPIGDITAHLGKK